MSRERDRRIVLSATAGVGLRVAQAAGAIVTVPVILHALGPAQFGIWGAVTSLAWLTGFVDLGVGNALITLLARSLAADDPEPARRGLAAGLSVALALALLQLAVGAGLVWVFAPPAQLAPYLIAVAGLALNAPLGIANNVWWGLQKGYIAAGWDIFQTVCMVAFTFLAVAVSGDVADFAAVVFGGTMLSNSGSLCHVLLTHRELRPRALLAPVAAMGRMLASGSLYLVIAAMAGLAYLLDNVLALALLGPHGSARMAIALRICITLANGLWTMVQPLWPAFTDAAARGDRAWIGNRLLRGSGLVLAAALACAILMVGFGGPALRWWLHADLGFDRGLLACMAAWVIILGLVRLPSLLLNALSLLRFQAAIMVVATAAAYGLKLFLAPRFGVAGILASTPAIWLIFVGPAFAWRICRWLTQTRQE